MEKKKKEIENINSFQRIMFTRRRRKQKEKKKNTKENYGIGRI